MSASDVLGEGACSRGSVLVQDSLEAPAAFMIPLLLKHALKQGDKVVFVAASQPKSHYKQVMRKMGIDIDASIASGRLEVVAFLSDYPEWCNQSTADPGCVCQALYSHIASGIVRLCSSRPGPNDGAVPVLNNEGAGGAGTAAANGTPGGQLTLIIDDISAIAAVAGTSSASHVTRILQSARGLCSNLNVAPHRFVCLAHDDSSTEDIDSPWVLRLAAAADAIVRTDHLGGASEDVHGQVSVHQKRAWENGEGTLSRAAVGSSSFYFRLTEGSIRFWAAM